jgi:predicted MFS family arabinose efflux permease
MATAVAFGPARMGFGLFLPTFRQAFDLSTTQAGLIASGGFLAFLVALPLTAWWTRRAGPRPPVVTGALAAILGFTVVATASHWAALAVGVALAGTSAGFCWAPFNDAAEWVIPEERRPGTLSAVSTGTTLGVAAAGALAWGVSADVLGWRSAWGLFVLVALVTALAVVVGMPAGHRGTGTGSGSGTGTGAGMLHPRRVPLYATSVIFGATNAVYVSFAADRVATAGGLPGLAGRADTAAAVIFLAYGLFGLLGLATGRMEAGLGLARVLSLVFCAFAASLALIGVLPGATPGVVASAGLHGAAVMMISAVLSVWTLRLFPGRASVGFTAALVAVAVGSVIGPALAGAFITAVGPLPAFLLFALPSLGVAVFFLARPGYAGV